MPDYKNRTRVELDSNGEYIATERCLILQERVYSTTNTIFEFYINDVHMHMINVVAHTRV